VKTSVYLPWTLRSNPLSWKSRYDIHAFDIYYLRCIISICRWCWNVAINEREVYNWNVKIIPLFTVWISIVPHSQFPGKEEGMKRLYSVHGILNFKLIVMDPQNHHIMHYLKIGLFVFWKANFVSVFSSSCMKSSPCGNRNKSSGRGGGQLVSIGKQTVDKHDFQAQQKVRLLYFIVWCSHETKW
jgi:hypothetical protein